MADILDDGIELLNLKVGNRALSIAPVCDMVQGFTELLSYKRKQVNRIRLAVEEMLTERVENAYDNEGDITLEVILMPEWLRIKFTDSGNVYRLDGDNASLSAKIILANVDAYGSVINEDDLMADNLDWKYPESYNMDKFLQQENKD
jgi:fatty-acyl-CoA synthase